MPEPSDRQRPFAIAVWSSRASFQQSAAAWVRGVGGYVAGITPVRDDEVLASAEAVLVDMETAEAPNFATVKAVCRRFPRLDVVVVKDMTGPSWEQNGWRPGSPALVPAPLQPIHVEALAQLLRATPPQALLTLEEMTEILQFQRG